jgi:pSer/pThr/pTyr-binding forkhead associated (FHA) protein
MENMGGGFCEKHGPFDPPHQTCPYCAREDQQRRAYGPPDAAPAPGVDATGFRRETVESTPPPDVTEVVPRPESKNGADQPEREPLGWLVVKEPVERRGAVLAVRPNQVIGRSGDVQWDDPRISRQHARLTFEAPEDGPDDPLVFHLWPFGPANPVYINGREIRGATPLHENDEVRLGQTLFVFKVLVD